MSLKSKLDRLEKQAPLAAEDGSIDLPLLTDDELDDLLALFDDEGHVRDWDEAVEVVTRIALRLENVEAKECQDEVN